MNGGATCDVLLGKHNADRHFYTLGDSFITRFPLTMNYDDMTMTFYQFVDSEDVSLLKSGAVSSGPSMMSVAGTAAVIAVGAALYVKRRNAAKTAVTDAFLA